MQLQNALLHSLPDLKVAGDHRIANNLASLGSIIRLQSAAVRKSGKSYRAEDVCSILQDLGTRIEVTARLHKYLANSPAGSKIDLGKFIREICQTLESLAQSGQLDLKVGCRCTSSVEAGVALPIGLLIAELVTNSAKYAHPTGLPVKVALECETHSNGGFTLRFEDDGVGLPENFDPTKDGGLGFRLMRAMADHLKATLTFNHDELGLRCELVKKSGHLAS
jgi:two-component sensor histidine kinase